MRRGSPRAERSRIRVDDGWLGATRQSFILTTRTNVWSVVLMLAYHSQRHIHTLKKIAYGAVGSRVCGVPVTPHEPPVAATAMPLRVVPPPMGCRRRAAAQLTTILAMKAAADAAAAAWRGRHLSAAPRYHRSCATLSPRLRCTSRFCASSSLVAGTDRFSTPPPHKTSGRLAAAATPLVNGATRRGGSMTRPFVGPLGPSLLQKATQSSSPST